MRNKVYNVTQIICLIWITMSIFIWQSFFGLIIGWIAMVLIDFIYLHSEDE